MKKIILLLAAVVICNVTVFAGGGNGGPMGMAYVVDLSPLNAFLAGTNPGGTNYDVPAFDPQIMMWGGSGTNWATNALGIGIMGAGGFQMKFGEGNGRYAAIYTACGTVTFEPIIIESKLMQLVFKFGPGFMTNHLVLMENTSGTTYRHEYAINSYIIFAGVGMQLKMSESTRLEIGAGYFGNTLTNWELITTTNPGGMLNKPAGTDFSGLNAFVALKFGTIGSGGGVTINPTTY
jgi:hypothetical protein